MLSIDLKRVRAEVTDVWSGEPTDDATLVQKVAEYGRSPGFPPDPPERMSTLGGLREQLVGSEDSSKKGERIAEQHAPIAPPSRVIVADDHPLFRYALRSVLECSESFEVITEAADGQQALELARTHNPDLVLMDVRMPKMDGLEATRAIKRVLPQTVVLMLTAHEETSHLAEAIKAGAAGYVLKGESPQQITAAIHAALDGESPLDPEVARRLILDLMYERGNNERPSSSDVVAPGGFPSPPALVGEHHPHEKGALPSSLTAREVQVLGLLTRGLSNQLASGASSRLKLEQLPFSTLRISTLRRECGSTSSVWS